VCVCVCVCIKTPLNALAQVVPKRLDTNKIQTILYNAIKAQRKQKQEERNTEKQQAKKLSSSRLKDSAATLDNQNQN